MISRHKPEPQSVHIVNVLNAEIRTLQQQLAEAKQIQAHDKAHMKMQHVNLEFFKQQLDKLREVGEKIVSRHDEDPMGFVGPAVLEELRAALRTEQQDASK